MGVVELNTILLDNITAIAKIVGDMSQSSNTGVAIYARELGEQLDKTLNQLENETEGTK